MSPQEIRQLRDRGGFTQKEFANIVGVSRAAVSQWENGFETPSDTRVEIMKALRRELKKREGKELRKSLIQAGGALSLSIFLQWLTSDD